MGALLVGALLAGEKFRVKQRARADDVYQRSARARALDLHWVPDCTQVRVHRTVCVSDRLCSCALVTCRRRTPSRLSRALPCADAHPTQANAHQGPGAACGCGPLKRRAERSTSTVRADHTGPPTSGASRDMSDVERRPSWLVMVTGKKRFRKNTLKI